MAKQHDAEQEHSVTAGEQSAVPFLRTKTGKVGLTEMEGGDEDEEEETCDGEDP